MRAATPRQPVQERGKRGGRPEREEWAPGADMRRPVYSKWKAPNRLRPEPGAQGAHHARPGN